MSRLPNPTASDLLRLATQIRGATDNVISELMTDNGGDGVCQSDLQVALDEMRGVLYELEIVAGEHK